MPSLSIWRAEYYKESVKRYPCPHCGYEYVIGDDFETEKIDVEEFYYCIECGKRICIVKKVEITYSIRES